MRRIGFLLLGLWLVIWGLMQLFNLHFTGEAVIMGILALAAGVLLLIEDTGGGGGERRRGRWRFAIGPGILLLAIFLILWGLLTLFSITFPYEPIVMGLLALIAGIMLFVRR
jgi:hypothetical protein